MQWICPGGEEPCGQVRGASLSEVRYRADSNGGPRGAVIDLPRCECGTQTFLKADYTLKELFKCLLTLVDDAGVIRGYALPLAHVRNLRLHAILHERGQAVHAPALPMPPAALLQHPTMQVLGDIDVMHSIWFAYGIMRYHQAIACPFSEFFFDVTRTPLTLPEPERNLIDGPARN